MKKLSMAICLCILNLTIQAQTQSLYLFKHTLSAHHQKMINALITSQKKYVSVARKPTGLQQRVIAQYVPIMSLNLSIDSCTYKYSGNRTSTFNYDNVFSVYDANFENSYVPMFFDVQIQDKSVKADTIVNFHNEDRTIVSTANYNEQSKIDTIKLYATNRYEKTYHSYTTQNHLKAIIKKDAAGDTIEQKNYTYNAAETQIINDTSMKDGIKHKSDYHYNLQNLVDSISIFRLFSGGGSDYLTSLLTIEYNSASQIQMIHTFYYLQNGSMESHYIDSFAYAGNVDYATYHLTTQIQVYGSGPNDTFYNLDVKYVGANNLPDSMQTFYNFDNTVFHHFSSGSYSYNSYNNIVSFKYYFTDGTPSAENRYYYETFDTVITPTAVEEITNAKNLSIYPNPFSSNIFIFWTGKAAATTEISLTNMVGQIVYKQNWHLNSGTNGIPIQNLPIGNYILRLKDEDGNVITNKVVKR